MIDPAGQKCPSGTCCGHRPGYGHEAAHADHRGLQGQACHLGLLFFGTRWRVCSLVPALRQCPQGTLLAQVEEEQKASMFREHTHVPLLVWYSWPRFYVVLLSETVSETVTVWI